MTTHIIGTVILALTFGAFWHNQPARRHKHNRGERSFQLGLVVNGAWAWLLHLSSPLKKKRRVFLTGTGAKPKAQTELLPSARALLAWDPWHQIVVDRTPGQLSRPTDLLK